MTLKPATALVPRGSGPALQRKYRTLWAHIPTSDSCASSKLTRTYTVLVVDTGLHALTDFAKMGTNCNCGDTIENHASGFATALACGARCAANTACKSFGTWLPGSGHVGYCRLFAEACTSTCDSPISSSSSVNIVFNVNRGTKTVKSSANIHEMTLANIVA